MSEKKVQDRIDIELSRTYFGKPVTRKETKAANINENKIPKKLSKRLFIVPVLLIALIITSIFHT